jgi:hypothetical protein
VDNQNRDEKQGTQQAPGEDEQLRHKGAVRSTPEDQKSGPQPEGNGGTGKPAAFPPHN